MLKPVLAASFLLFAAKLTVFAADSSPAVVVSVPDQKLVVVRNGVSIASYPVSTSRFGIGDRPRTYCTPLGKLQVAAKVGAGAPEGAVFHGCRRTGEVLRPNATGRDPIVTRILRLRGLEAQNARAYDRGIYIHGTPQENRIGRPASFGCIRMRSRDVVRVFETLPVGADVQIVNTSISRALHEVATRGTAGNNAG
jgi:lipoprotein-anchoring transpeptidase ErfK/SrfK